MPKLYQVPSTYHVSIQYMIKDGGSAAGEVAGIPYWIDRAIGSIGTTFYGGVYCGEYGDRTCRLGKRLATPILKAFKDLS